MTEHLGVHHAAHQHFEPAGVLADAATLGAADGSVNGKYDGRNRTLSGFSKN
jgi:hypothetical protein